MYLLLSMNYLNYFNEITQIISFEMGIKLSLIYIKYYFQINITEPIFFVKILRRVKLTEWR